MEMVLAPGSCAQDGQGQGWALPLMTGARDSDLRKKLRAFGWEKKAPECEQGRPGVMRINTPESKRCLSKIHQGEK